MSVCSSSPAMRGVHAGEAAVAPRISLFPNASKVLPQLAGSRACRCRGSRLPESQVCIAPSKQLLSQPGQLQAVATLQGCIQGRLGSYSNCISDRDRCRHVSYPSRPRIRAGALSASVVAMHQSLPLRGGDISNDCAPQHRRATSRRSAEESIASPARQKEVHARGFWRTRAQGEGRDKLPRRTLRPDPFPRSRACPPRNSNWGFRPAIRYTPLCLHAQQV